MGSSDDAVVYRKLEFIIPDLAEYKSNKFFLLTCRGHPNISIHVSKALEENSRICDEYRIVFIRQSENTETLQRFKIKIFPHNKTARICSYGDDTHKFNIDAQNEKIEECNAEGYKKFDTLLAEIRSFDYSFKDRSARPPQR